MAALDERTDVDLIRIDGQHGVMTAATLASLGRFRGYGSWKYSRPNRQLTHAKVGRRLRKVDVDAVIGVADIETIADVPTFLFQDANFSVIQAHHDVVAEHAPALIKFPPGRLEDLIAEQRAAYASAAGVLSFSQWFADWLVEHDGVARERVHVVGGGLHDLPAKRDLQARGAAGTKVLFIGRDFHRKGGDLVVSAIQELRRSGSGDFRLTVVGPTKWPLPTPIPEWVDFLGEVPASGVRRLWANHDIFALPTWYEPYGLVFLEARAAGVPSLGRDAYCMPELVPSSAGRLIPPAGALDDIAEGILAISQDHDLFASVSAESDSVRASGTWGAVADRALTGIRPAITS